MSTQSVLENVELRTTAIQAETGVVCSELKVNSQSEQATSATINACNREILKGFLGIRKNMLSVLRRFHEKAYIEAFAAAPAERVHALIEKMTPVPAMMQQTLELWREFPCNTLWIMRRENMLVEMTRLNEQFAAHTAALSNNGFLLTEKDQQAFLRALENPPEPTEGLRQTLS